MKRREDRLLVQDMIHYARKAMRYARESNSLEGFRKDDKAQDALIRCYVVVGEAARQISAPLKSSEPQIPWADLVSMRNILAHEYYELDVTRLWITATQEMPGLTADFEALLLKLGGPMPA
jgi:uncharacterized protein with HEPN domain